MSKWCFEMYLIWFTLTVFIQLSFRCISYGPLCTVASSTTIKPKPKLLTSSRSTSTPAYCSCSQISSARAPPSELVSDRESRSDDTLVHSAKYPWKRIRVPTRREKCAQLPPLLRHDKTGAVESIARDLYSGDSTLVWADPSEVEVALVTSDSPAVEPHSVPLNLSTDWHAELSGEFWKRK